MPRKLSDPEPRFWAQVDRRGDDECWPWTGPRNRSGYGVFGVKRDGRWVYRHASRFALEFTAGDGAGMWALHTCDVPSCCNPAHLYWGTAAQNVADMMQRKRGDFVRGERHGMARLTEQGVAAIRSSDETPAVLADRYGVTARHIRKIKAGSTW